MAENLFARSIQKRIEALLRNAGVGLRVGQERAEFPETLFLLRTSQERFGGESFDLMGELVVAATGLAEELLPARTSRST
jgi:hypothetical protein